MPKTPFKNVILTTLSLCLVGLLTGASWFSSDTTEEITPLQYSALLGLREVDPVLFRKKLLPLITEAMKDNKITVAECLDIEKAAGNVAALFFNAAKAPRLQDSFTETVEKAQQGGKDLGSKLGDTMNKELPKLFDDTLNLFRNQMNQYNKENPEPATDL
ncbi:MAG: hypothetical protein RR317_05905 [Bilophila sp.]